LVGLVHGYKHSTKIRKAIKKFFGPKQLSRAALFQFNWRLALAQLSL
jgi:hypothetical protein